MHWKFITFGIPNESNQFVESLYATFVVSRHTKKLLQVLCECELLLVAIDQQAVGASERRSEGEYGRYIVRVQLLVHDEKCADASWVSWQL